MYVSLCVSISAECWMCIFSLHTHCIVCVCVCVCVCTSVHLHLLHFHLKASILAEIIRSGVCVSPEEWVTVWGSVAIHLFTLMERSEWNMADVVIAALHQRRERFLTLMLQSCLADSGALKTNNHPGQLESGKRSGGGQMGREEEGEGGDCRIRPTVSSSFSTIFH